MRFLLTFQFYFALSVIVFFTACSQKRYFEPKDVKLEAVFDKKLPAPIAYTTRDGALLKNLLVLESNGNMDLELKKKQSFLSRSGDVYVLQNECKDLLILDSSSKSTSEITFQNCVVSAAIDPKRDLLALVSAENTIFLYDLKDKKELFSQKLGNIIAINSLSAAPQITKDYVVYPTLDGKILLLDLRTKTITKDILIQSDKFFNNIIYLYTKNETIITATQRRVSTILGNSKSFNHDGDFIDVLVHDDKVYVLSNDGKILELDRSLKLLREAKFEFAHFNGLVIKDGKLYTLESAKYLIELDLESFLPVIYKVRLPKKKHLFYTKDSLFYHDRYKKF